MIPKSSQFLCLYRKRDVLAAMQRDMNAVKVGARVDGLAPARIEPRRKAGGAAQGSAARKVAAHGSAPAGTSAADHASRRQGLPRITYRRRTL